MSTATTGMAYPDVPPFSLSNLRRLDLRLAAVVLTLAVIGAFMLVSADQSIALGTPVYIKQLIFFAIGSGLAVVLLCTYHRVLVSAGPLWYIGSIVLLLAVEFWGYEAKGGQRWIDLGVFNLQPSEISKLSLVFFLAWYFDRIGRKITKLPHFLLAIVFTCVPAFLIFKQPNLGTAAALFPVLFAMIWVAGCKRAHLIGIIALGLLAMPVAWSQMKDYQKNRVMTFLDPSADPQGSGYHTIQSIITVGSGGLTGKGFQEGTQTYLRYLPEHHTDFIFSLLAEELGFVGAVSVLFLFALLFLRGLQIARNSLDMSGSLVAVGIVAVLAYHVFVNIAITVGLMPVTGLPLPFLSYGGSFYLLTMMCIGVLMSIQARRGLFVG